MSRVVWQDKVEATAGQVRLVAVEYDSLKYPGKSISYVLESSRQNDAMSQPVWLPVDLMQNAPRDHEAIKAALAALGQFASLAGG